MPVPFIMPKFDMDQEKATIISWLKKEGDLVKFDETILTVETEKVAIDVPSPASGTLAGILYKAGDIVPVTKVIAYILKEGETLADLPGLSMPVLPHKPESAPVSQPIVALQAVSVNATPVAVRMAKEEGVDLARVSASSGDKITREDVERYIEKQKSAGRVTVPATPAARRVANESGILLETVAGSGPRGRVLSTDVTAMARSVLTSTVAAGSRDAEVVPLSNIRSTIARRMQRSFNESPHIFEAIEADISQLEILRKRLNQYSERNGSVKISMTAILVKIIAWALERNPYINSSLDGENIHLWKNINVGVATAIDSGLIVPVVHDANLHSISQIAARIQDTSARAKSGSLGLSDVTHGTFTVSNLGMFGIHQFRAIINPPESAILAVGTVIRKPVVVDEKDTVEVRPMMNFTLSADHRVIDGVVAAKFLTDLAAGIEAPSLLLF